MKKLVQKNHYDYSAKLEAFPYQHEAFNEIKDKDYAAIFHEQGLGKTKIAIDLLLYWLKNREIDTVLIVTKKTLVKYIFTVKIELTSILCKYFQRKEKDHFLTCFMRPALLFVLNFFFEV